MPRVRAVLKLRLEQWTWCDVEEYLKRDDRLIVPVGSTEQHGPHLPLVTDWYVPYRIGEAVSLRSGVPLAPPLCYGMSLFHSAFPGTVALRPDTLMRVLEDILEAVYQHGFRRVLLLNGHGGNMAAIQSTLATFVQSHRELRVKVHSWWLIEPVAKLSEQVFGQVDSHAGPAETSVMLALCSDAVRPALARPNRSPVLPYVPNARQMRELYPDGTMQNDPTLARPELGAELVEACVQFFLKELEFAE